jgi:hypothetical protein
LPKQSHLGTKVPAGFVRPSGHFCPKNRNEIAFSGAAAGRVAQLGLSIAAERAYIAG